MELVKVLKVLINPFCDAADRFCSQNFELLNFIFYLDTVNLSDKIIILLQSIITVTIYFNLYKHDLKFKSKIEKNKEILLYIDAVCVLSIQRKKLRQPFRKD